MDIDHSHSQADYYSEESEEDDDVDAQEEDDDSDAQDLDDAFEDGDDSDESEYIENVEEGRDTTGDGAFAELEDLADGLPADDEEDAFERLLGSISQSNGDLYADGGLAQEHDASIATELASIRDDLAIAKGFGKRRRRGPRERRLPQKIQDLLGEGNAAYAMEDKPKAIAIMHEVIRIDATVVGAWNLLALIHSDMGNLTKALGLEMMAAHLKQDSDTWKVLAEKSKDAGHLGQALYCLRRYLAMRPEDTDALRDQASLFEKQGNAKKALESYQRLLALSPHDLSVLKVIPPLLSATNNVNEGARLYEAAFEHYTRRPYRDDGASTSYTSWDMDLLISLADFMLLTYDFEGVIGVVKRGQRWFQGRGREAHWDLIPDDREYDPAGTERVNDAPHLGHGEGYQLDLILRHRLAVARLKLAHDEDAMIHIDEILMKTDVAPYTALWADIGSALIERGFYPKALEVFGELAENPDVQQNSDQAQQVEYVRSLAICHQHLGNHAQAIEAFRFVCDSEPDDLSMKLQLAEALETAGDKVQALELVNQVLEARRERGPEQRRQQEVGEEDDSADDEGASSGLFGSRDKGRKKDRPRDRKSKQDVEELQRREATASFAILKGCDESANLGDPSAVQQYKMVAGKLLSQFRTSRALYPVDRSRKYIPFSVASKKTDGLQQQDFDLQVVDMATRLQAAKDDEQHEDGPTHMLLKQRTRFHGLTADQWLELCIKHCCLLMRLDENEEAAEILHHVSFSTIFDPPKYNTTLNLALLATHIRLHDCNRMLEVIRLLIRSHQYSSDTYLLLSAALGSGIKPADAFANLNLQKFLLREIKLWDSAASGDHRLRWNPRTGRWVLPNAGIGVAAQKDDEMSDSSMAEMSASAAAPVRPKKKSPVLYTIYGEVLLIAKSYQSAIHYLLQAFDVNPYDPLLCLLLAQAYIGRAMNRQSDNRHHQIVTGIAFMNRYKILRQQTDCATAAEIDYNIARAYHGLGKGG